MRIVGTSIRGRASARNIDGHSLGVFFPVLSKDINTVSSLEKRWRGPLRRRISIALKATSGENPHLACIVANVWASLVEYATDFVACIFGTLDSGILGVVHPIGCGLADPVGGR
jgi:hypothetical protein